MGEAVENLIALAGGVQRVRAYMREQNGKMVKVRAYTRAPGEMSNEDIDAEIRALRADHDDVAEEDFEVQQRRFRLTALLREAAARQRSGAWGNDTRDQLNRRGVSDPNDSRSDLLSQRGPAPEISYPPGHSKAPKDAVSSASPGISYPPGHSRAPMGEVVEKYLQLQRRI